MSNKHIKKIFNFRFFYYFFSFFGFFLGFIIMYVMELKFLNCFYVVSFYSTIYFIFINLYLLIGSLLDLIKILKIKNYYINSFCFILNEFCLIFLLFIGQVPLNVIFIMYKIYKQTFKKFLIIFILILIIFFMIISFR